MYLDANKDTANGSTLYCWNLVGISIVDTHTLHLILGW